MSVKFLRFDDAGLWNPAVDLFQFLLQLPTEVRKEYQDIFLANYFFKLSKFSAVKKSQYTFKKLEDDLRTYGPSCILGLKIWKQVNYNDPERW